MSRRNIGSGSIFEYQIGYSRAVIQGPWVFVSGCTGYNYATRSMSTDVVAQAQQCMINIHAALQQAGAEMTDVVRVRYILPRREDFEKCWPILLEWLGEVRPAATMIVAGLFEEEMKIEVEVTACVGRQADEAKAEPPA